MIQMDRWFLALTLGAGMLVAPIAVFASGSPQAQAREVTAREQTYDRDLKDYHDWNKARIARIGVIGRADTALIATILG